MDEVNFIRLPYLVNHTISAIENDTVILLGRSSSKSILLYYIIRELHQINGKKKTLINLLSRDYRTPIKRLQDSYKFPINFLWISYKSPIKRLQDSYQEIT